MNKEVRLTHQYGESKNEHKFEGQIVFPDGFSSSIVFQLSERANSLLTLMIGTALMLPSGSSFSCNSILDEIGSDVYSDIYDEEIFVINHLFDLYFECRCSLYELGEEDNIKYKIFKR